MINGDLAIQKYDPTARLDGERSEPVSIQQGPQKGDILLVLIDQCRAACEVLNVSTTKGRPLYLVKYDDGMLVQDHLVVPWTYVSTSSTTSGAIALAASDETAQPPSTDSNPGVAATESTSAPSNKSLGKRRMINSSTAETVKVPHAPAAAPAASAAASSVAASPAATALFDETEKMWKAMRELPSQQREPEKEQREREKENERQREMKLEKQYGELLDTIVL